MSLPDGELRQRKRGVAEVVQELDAFVKVIDDVKEEKRAVNGILSVICFGIIAILVAGQVYDYLVNTTLEYKFSVDTDFDEEPNLDIDMVVAMPCDSLAVLAGQERTSPFDEKKTLGKNPTRFELNEEEERLWKTLQRVHEEQFQPGNSLKSLNDLTFVPKNIEKGLMAAADRKVADEAEEIERKRLERKDEHAGGGGDAVIIIGNGFGVLQVISSHHGPSEGTACRVSGKMAIRKGKEEGILITAGTSLGGGLIANFGIDKVNFSHRIERFNFGPHVWGLVTPLAGVTEVAPEDNMLYQYFIKVVPTRIHHSGLFGGSTLTYQYSVTSLKKNTGEKRGLMFMYEFTATVIEVREVSTSLTQFLLRLCAVVGGIFATSTFVQTLISKCFGARSKA